MSRQLRLGGEVLSRGANVVVQRGGEKSSGAGREPVGVTVVVGHIPSLAARSLDRFRVTVGGSGGSRRTS